MLKKIEVFITLFILSCTIIFKTYVFASVPAEVDFPLLNDAIQTLYFMTGLGYKVENVNDEQGLYELMDDKTKALWANEQTAKKERLQNYWNEFIDSVKRGYGLAFHCNNELYEYMQEKAYADVIAPNVVYKDAPQQMKNWLASQNGNIILVANAQGGLAPDKKLYRFFNVGSYTPLETPVILSQGSYASSPTGFEYNWRLTQEYSYNISYRYCDMGNNENYFGQSDPITYQRYATCWTNYNPIEYAYILNHTSAYAFSTDALINDYISKGQYTDIIDNVYGVDTNGDVIIDSTGELPNTIGRDTTNDYINDITDGQTTWGQIIGSYADSEPAVPSIPADGALTLPQLDNLIADLHLERLNTKFPFCIPSDIKLIFDGATSVSSNAPVIHIPIHLEFRNHVYYDNSDGIVIDFNTFEPVVIIFREGFFLLFLLGLIWSTIEIMQAFFIATE